MSWFSKAKEVVSPTVIKKKFVPKSDITAYEVAYILSRCNMWTLPAHEVNFPEEKWNALEPQYKRHFEDRE